MTTVYIGGHGIISIQDNDALQARVSALRERVAGNAANKPVGKQIFSALVRWEQEVRDLLDEYAPLQEYKSYMLYAVPMAAIEEAERLNAEGKAATAAQGPTFKCRMTGCQNHTRARGTLCPRCQHDED